MKSRVALGALALVLAASDAFAGGLQVSDRGVRPLGRGGAFVAGADDMNAMWYNPAGLAEAGSSLLADFDIVLFSASYTRRTVLNDAESGAQFERTSPTVHGTNKFLPIPTGGFSFAFGDRKQYVLAAGAFAPQAVATSYPETGAQRYTLVDQSGSVLSFVGGWFAWKALPWLDVGGGPMALTGFYSARITFNANPRDRLLGAPEDPNYDARGQNNAGLIFAPGANAGVTLKPEKHVRIGFSVQTPFTIHAPAELLISLPNAVEFDDASVKGKDATLRFQLPWVIRAGVEARPLPDLRLEIAYTHDFWSRSKDFTVDPHGVNLYGIKGFPSPYAVSAIKIPLGFEDTNTIRFGGEYRMRRPLRRWLPRLPVDVEPRAGVMWDPAAASNPYLSVLTFDTDRVHASIGGSLYVGEHWRLDSVFMHSFFLAQDVDPRVAAVAGINPVAGNATKLEAVNGGHYTGHVNTFGFGAQYKF